MKAIFIIFCNFLFLMASSQEKKVYLFYVHLDHYSNAPDFKKDGDMIVYTGNDQAEKQFFDKYSILDFFQAYPDSRRERTLNIYMFATYNNDLMQQLLETFPNKFLKANDVTDNKVEYLNSYPNDYGITSPPWVTNLGLPANLKNLDYINAPKAWDYTYGNPEVLIGISDAGLDTTDIEFKFKTSFIPGFTTAPPSNDNTKHGTTVTAIAAAQGNNGNGIVGVCSDCGIVMARSTYGSPGTYENPTPNFNRLLQLAIAGARVINMSWRYPTYDDGYQWVIDEIYEDYDVVLVGGSGNENPDDLTYKTYPASHNHVISVTGVNHKNQWGDETITYGNIVNHRFVADQIAPSVFIHPDGSLEPNASLTINEDVDICAPGSQIFMYAAYVLSSGGPYYNEAATSPAAPHVSGTVGLMFSINECLKSDEVEAVLKLTAKNLETVTGNQEFAGRIGAGKLEAGDAVEFVHEMMSPVGTALIDGQDFYRFNFKLEHINNKLLISNQTFRDNCTADFTARKTIEILPNTDLRPATDGFVDLKINGDVDITCDNAGRIAMTKNRKGIDERKQIVQTKSSLFPNPNKGTFGIKLGFETLDAVYIQIYDISGKGVYQDVRQADMLNFDMTNLASGLYLIKITSGATSETIKFIKE